MRALALEQPDMLREQLLHSRLVDQFDLVHVLDGAVAARQVRGTTSTDTIARRTSSGRR